MRRAQGDHHDRLGLKSISCSCHFMSPPTAGSTPDLAGKNQDMKCSTSHPAGCTLDFSNSPILSLIIPIFILISLFLVHNSTITREFNGKLSLSISPCNDQECTPSAAYSEYSTHRVQRQPKMVWILLARCLPWISPQLGNLWVQPQLMVCLHTNLPPPTSAHSAQRQCITFPQMLVTWCLQCQLLIEHLQIGLLQMGTISIFRSMSTFRWWWPPSASPNWLRYGLQVHLSVCSIWGSKCHSKLTPSHPASVSVNTLDHGL